MIQSITIANADGVRDALRQLGDDAPHALRIATTQIGEHAQRTMRSRLSERFTFRGTAAGFQKAVVFQSPREAARRKIAATLKVGSAQGGTKATATRNLGVILARHEDGGERTARQLYRMGNGKVITAGFFLPASGLRTSSANPPRAMYPTSIGAQIRSDPAGNAYFASGTKKGSKRRGTGASYFATEQGIFRRKHTQFGRAEVDAIWWFRKRVRTAPRLGLWTTANEVFERFAVAYAMDAIDLVLERTGPRRLT